MEKINTKVLVFAVIGIILITLAGFFYFFYIKKNSEIQTLKQQEVQVKNEQMEKAFKPFAEKAKDDTRSFEVFKIAPGGIFGARDIITKEEFGLLITSSTVFGSGSIDKIKVGSIIDVKKTDQQKDANLIIVVEISNIK